MNQFEFTLENQDSLIRIDAQIGKSDFSLALDTGATHTVIDLTVMLMNGYNLNDVVRTVDFETAKGSIEAYVFKVRKLKALGRIMHEVEVSSYDFIGNNVIFDIDGVLGLDFFKGTSLKIDFNNFVITLE